jgi:GAF domain-containing protein
MAITVNLASQEVTREGSFESKLIATFADICRYACRLLNVDHSGFVRFNTLKTEGQVVAQYPVEPGMENRRVQLRGVPAEERLLETDEPLVIEDVANAPELGDVQVLLLEFDIRSICIVKVRLHGVVIGSFSLDSIGKTRVFTESEIAHCRSFAELASNTIEHARLADWLEALLRATAAISSEREVKPLLESIIHHASRLFGAESVGLYERCLDELGRDGLRLIASSNERLVGRILYRGEGMAWQLLDGTDPYLTTPDYDKYPQRSVSLEGNFGSVLEVPLERQNERVGVIYLSDAVGRRFTDFDAELLQRFADVATLALQQRGLFARVKELSDAIIAISRDLSSKPLEMKLTEIAEHATRILNAEMCGVFRVETKERLILQASYGHKDGHFKQDHPFEIRDGVGTGLVGALAARLIAMHTGPDAPDTGAVINLCGRKLREDAAIKGLPEAEASGTCHSLLAIPLLTKSANRREVYGMLRVTNKKGPDGRPHRGACFNEEDAWILRVFAESVVVAIESARLFRELHVQKDLYERLLETWNTLASEELLETRLRKIAESIVLILRKTYCRILLTEESDEVLTLKALALHPRNDEKPPYEWNPERKQRTSISMWPLVQEAFRTGSPYELSIEHDTDGTLARLSEILGLRDPITKAPVVIHTVFSIPMATSSRRVGLISIGDVRRSTFDRGGFSLDAKNLATAIAAQATVMIDREWRRQTSERREEMLSRLSEAAVQIRAETDDPGRYSVIARQTQIVFRCAVAGFLEQARSGGPVLVYTSTGEEITLLSETSAASGLGDLLNEEVTAESTSEIFEQLVHNLPALHHLRLASALAVRVESASRARCLLFVGDHEDQAVLTRDDLRILKTLAAHCAATLNTTAARTRLTGALDGVHLVAQDLALGEGGHALDSVVAGIRNAMGGDLVTIYRIKKQGETVVGYPTSTTLQDRSVSAAPVRDVSKTVVGKVLAASPAIIMEDDLRSSGVLYGPFVERHNIVSALGMTIGPPAISEPVGVLFVDYTSFHRFTSEDERIAKMFAHLAAVAIQNQDLYDRVQRKAKQAEALRKAARDLGQDVDYAEAPQLISNVVHEVAASFVGQITVVVVALFLDRVGRLAATYPPEKAEHVRARIDRGVPLDSGRGGRIGVLGRAMVSGRTEMRNNVSVENDPDYLPIDEQTKSMLVAPIKEGGVDFAAINVESAEPFAFEESDRETFDLLASLALDALRSARKNAEVEKMRVGAQPDAAWKEISFSAAHKIGNPIFAIETYLRALGKRVTEGRSDEAQAVIGDMLKAVEKAKGIVGQFKSLSRAANVNPMPIQLRPLLEDACEAARAHNIATSIDCSESIKVLGDARRLAECFDELIANSLLWLDKPQPAITVTAAEAKGRLSPELAADRRYVVIHFRDNGPGVPVKMKTEIFDAFVTTHPEGNGLGLDLVRRIIQSHGGVIVETGIPGEGADFEIYLPNAMPPFRR